jgi:hypothetical protein
MIPRAIRFTFLFKSVRRKWDRRRVLPSQSPFFPAKMGDRHRVLPSQSPLFPNALRGRALGGGRPRHCTVRFMCLLALFFRVVEDAPLIVGANREELYARGGEPPRVLDGILAGVDPRAGGTWLGVNKQGVLVAVTNRPKTQLAVPLRSRGLLVRELLATNSAAAAAQLAAREFNGNRYAGCNILCADRDSAVVLHAGDWLRVRPLPPGLHVLTAHDVNDASDRRIGHSLWWLSQRSYANGNACVAALQELCAQRGNGDPPICLHGKEGGTVSSSIVMLSATPAQSLYLHAQGPPDTIPYADYSSLLRQMLTSGTRA